MIHSTTDFRQICFIWTSCLFYFHFTWLFSESRGLERWKRDFTKLKLHKRKNSVEYLSIPCSWCSVSGILVSCDGDLAAKHRKGRRAKKSFVTHVHMVPCVWEQMKNWWFCLNGVAWINMWCSPVTAESRSVAACTGRTASHIVLFIISFRKIYFHSVPVWRLYCQHLFPLLTCSMTLVFVCTWVCFKSSMIRSEGGPGCWLDLTSGSQGKGGWPLYWISSLCGVGFMATLGD